MSDVSYRLSVSRDDFSKLLNLLKLFENNCTDCDIQHGKFRCRTNDRQAVIEMDLNSILQTNNLSFSLIKTKVALLKTFELDDNVQVEDKTITIESNESNYEICDPMSRLILRKPLQRYIDNQFITDDDFGNMIRISEDNLIFSHTINNYMKKRTSDAALNLQTDIVECKINESQVSLAVCNSNHEDSMTVAANIPVNRDVGNKQFKMISLPFVLDMAADLKINCYQNTQDVYLCKFELSFYGVSIILYTQVKVTNI